MYIVNQRLNLHGQFIFSNNLSCGLSVWLIRGNPEMTENIIYV